jgi:hypothetical protein
MTERADYVKPIRTNFLMILAFLSLIQNVAHTEVQLLEAGWVPSQHYASTGPTATERQDQNASPQLDAGQQASPHDVALEVRQGAAELAQQLAPDELTRNHEAVVMSQPGETRQAVEQQEQAGKLKELMKQLDEGLEGIPDAAKTMAEGQPDVRSPEIKELQAKHEVAQQEMNERFKDKQHEQSVTEEKLQKDYFERYPDQTKAERFRDEQKFEGAKQHNREDLMTRQQAQMDKLLQEQQQQLQQLQQSQAQRDAQVRQEFQQNKDDMFR